MIKIHILGSGSNANAFILESEQYLIHIDNGFSKREFLKRTQQCSLDFSKKSFFLLTHTHSDHIKGVPDIIDYLGCPLFTSDVQEFLNIAQKIKPEKINNFLPRLFPIKHLKKNRIEGYDSFDFIGFPTYHDCPGSTGYFIRLEDKNILYMTDTGNFDKIMLKFGMEADIIFLESNYDSTMLLKGSYPFMLKKRIASDKGHLSNDQAMIFIESLFANSTVMQTKNREKNKIGFKRIFLCHLSDNNNHPDIVKKGLIDKFTDFIENENNNSILLSSDNKKFLITITPKNTVFSELFRYDANNISQV